MTPEEKNKLALETLLRHSIEASQVIVLTGYVRFTEDDPFVRIYPALNQPTYFQVPPDKIVDAELAVPGLSTGPMRVVIDSTARIDLVQSLDIEKSFLTGSISNINLAGTVGDRCGHQGPLGPTFTTNPNAQTLCEIRVPQGPTFTTNPNAQTNC